MKIYSKRRFFIFVLMLFVVVHMLLNTISNTSLFKNSDICPVENFEEVKILVKKGDTAWTIQSELAPNNDVRKVLYLAEQINGRTLGSIKEGETLTFLQEKKTQ